MADELIMKALEGQYKLLVELRDRRAKCVRWLAEADEEIAKVTPKIVGLAALVDDVPEDSELGQFLIETASMGITDAVRSVLRSTPGMMQPTDIRDALIRMGVKLAAYQNPLAVIGSTLKRLEEAGDVIKTTPQGKPWYSWSRPRELPPVRIPNIEQILQGSHVATQIQSAVVGLTLAAHEQALMREQSATGVFLKASREKQPKTSVAEMKEEAIKKHR